MILTLVITGGRKQTDCGSAKLSEMAVRFIAAKLCERWPRKSLVEWFVCDDKLGVSTRNAVSSLNQSTAALSSVST